MKAQASITDSIAAPWLGVMPTSPQNATRCDAGMAIGMQQQKLAMQISTIAALGWQTEHLLARPRTRLTRPRRQRFGGRP